MKKIYLTAIVALTLSIMYSCGGDPGKSAGNAPANAGPEKKSATAVGEDLYKKNCVACHQSDGGGITNSFPPLAKSDYIAADKERAILQVIKGKSGEMKVNGSVYNGTMPPQQLNDDEIAAVLTYVYSSFGNTGGPVTAAEVKAVRDKN